MAVPTEAYAFLGAVAVFLLLLTIFFLYLNKKLCFAECGGFPCITKPNKDSRKENDVEKRNYDAIGHAPVITIHNEDSQTISLPSSKHESGEVEDSSSDSDEEVRQRYQNSIDRPASQRSSRSHRSKNRSRQSRDSGLRSSEDDHLVSNSSVYDPDAESRAYDSYDGGSGGSNHTAEVSVYNNEGFQDEREPSSVASADPGRSMENLDHDENLFDVSDLQDREPVFISKCGTLEVAIQYDAEKGKMNIAVHRANDIPSKERGGSSSTQIRLLILPAKKTRFKTKIRNGENPEYGESFQFKVPLEEVNNMGVRFRLYGCERMRKERMIGESIVGFASINLDQETVLQLQLEPRSNLSHGDSKSDLASLSRSDSASSTQSMQHGGMPELLIGLTYNGTTGRLSVEAIKGSNFRNMAMNRAPDTYVKLTLMSPNGQEIARSKTSIRRGQPNPLFKETFMFQVALFQLPDVTLMVSVYNKRNMKRKEMIGWFSLGLNNSGEEEMAHWTEMRESRGEQVSRWHVLLES